MNKKTWLYLAGFGLVAVAAYQVKRKADQVVDDIYTAGVDARTATEETVLEIDNALWGVPSALGKWWMVDILQLWEDETPKPYNWLEGSDGRWPGI